MNRHDEFTEFLKNSELAQEFRRKQNNELVKTRREKIIACARLREESLKTNTQMQEIINKYRRMIVFILLQIVISFNKSNLINHL